VEKRGFPRGKTTASRLKVLFACYGARKGRAAAGEWLALSHVRPEELEDETRLLPLTALARSLDAFVEAFGSEAIDEAATGFLARENLGLWARVLRGHTTPEAAFPRLDGTESEYGRTTVWETLEVAPGRWRGRARLAHDPRLELNGNLASLRAAELSIVPCLFGYSRGRVTRTAGEGADEYVVEWALPVSGPRALALGACGGVAVGGVSAGAAFGALAGAATALGAGIVGALAGHLVARERGRKIAARAQSIRLAALERSLELRELREGSAAGDLVGTIVAGQYRLVKSMGSGATGVIYEALRMADDRPVAVKLLRAAAAHDTVASDRLRREAEALGLAWHPNVVESLDHGHLPDGSAYLVMELLRGQSLADRLRERGRLSPEELRPLAVVLADALAAIHAAGVIHRDLKPDNIFLVKGDDGEEVVKILDFGIARVEWEEMRITNLGTPMGTPGYMAPEQEAGQEVDARADLYALGATLHECLVGELPAHPGAPSSADEPRERALSGHAGSGVHRSALPADWRSVLDACLARSPDDRYSDARGLARALRGLGDGARAAEER